MKKSNELILKCVTFAISGLVLMGCILIFNWFEGLTLTLSFAVITYVTVSFIKVTLPEIKNARFSEKH